VSHSISVGNRTSLAYMSPATYMTHRMAQVAFMNTRKLHRLSGDNPTGESDHLPLAPFYHNKLVRECERGPQCSCQDKRSVPEVTAAIGGQHVLSVVSNAATADGSAENDDGNVQSDKRLLVAGRPSSLADNSDNDGQDDARCVDVGQDGDWISDSGERTRRRWQRWLACGLGLGGQG